MPADSTCSNADNALLVRSDRYRSVVVIVVVTSAIVMIVIEFLAQMLRDVIIGVARQNIARGGLCNQAIRVLLQQEALAHLLSGGVPHYAVVSLLAAVTLLDRAARIAARQPRGLGHGKRNVAGGQIAFVALQRPGCDRVPARVGSQRRLQQH